MDSAGNPEKLYLLMGEMRGMLTSILTRLENTNENHKVLEETTTARFDAHSNRIAALEKFRWQIAGMIALLPFILTVAGWFLFN